MAHNFFIDQRVKYMSIGGFKAKVKSMTRQEFESFKHWEDVLQVEEEAVLVPYSLYLRMQQMIAETETRQ